MAEMVFNENRKIYGTGKPRGGKVCDVVTALIGFLFLVTLSVTVVLNLRCIYYHDINALDIPGMSGYSEETIRHNYDILIDYNVLFRGSDTLEFDGFTMSESGRIHFEEVKQIFVLFQYGCILFGVLFLICLVFRLRKGAYDCLKLGAIFSLGIPTVLGIAVSACWEKVFLLFHRIVFRNDYWLFDPVTDPVILILPDEFFFHCAAAIVLMIAAGSLVMGGGYLVAAHKKK